MPSTDWLKCPDMFCGSHHSWRQFVCLFIWVFFFPWDTHGLSGMSRNLNYSTFIRNGAERIQQTHSSVNVNSLIGAAWISPISIRYKWLNNCSAHHVKHKIASCFRNLENSPKTSTKVRCYWIDPTVRLLFIFNAQWWLSNPGSLHYWFLFLSVMMVIRIRKPIS